MFPLNFKHVAYKLKTFEDIDLLTYMISQLRQVIPLSSDSELPLGPGNGSVKDIYVPW